MLPYLYFFKLNFFATFPFCHFSQVSRILPCKVEGFPSYFPLWFFFLGYPKYQPFAYESLLSKPSGSLLHHCVFEKDISVLRFLCFLVPFLSCLNPTLAALHVLRILSLVLSTGLCESALILAGWALFFLPSISWDLKTYPFMDFGLQIFWVYHPFLLWAQPLFNFTFHGVGPMCHDFFRPQQTFTKKNIKTSCVCSKSPRLVGEVFSFFFFSFFFFFLCLVS